MVFKLMSSESDSCAYKNYSLPGYILADELNNHSVTLKRIISHCYLVSLKAPDRCFSLDYVPASQRIIIKKNTISCEANNAMNVNINTVESKSHAVEQKGLSIEKQTVVLVRDDTEDGSLELNSEEISTIVNAYNEQMKLGVIKRDEPFAYNRSILLLSAVLSGGAAYKAFVGTYIFSTQKKYYIQAPLFLGAFGGFVGALPSVSFYTKSLNLMLTKIYRRQLGWSKKRIAANFVMGLMYGLSSFGMLESADHLDINWVLKEILHDCVLVVNTFLGMHKSDVIFRYLLELIDLARNVLRSQEPELLNDRLLQNRREKIIISLLKNQPLNVAMSESNTALLMHDLLKRRIQLNGVVNNQKPLESGQQPLINSEDVFSLSRYYTTDIPVYKCPFVFCNKTYDAAWPGLMLFRLTAHVVSFAVAAFAIVSNVGGLSFFMNDSMHILQNNLVARVVISALFSLAVLGLNLKDTKKYIEARMLQCINKSLQVHVVLPLTWKQSVYNSIFSMDTLAVLVSLWAATQGVVYTKNTLDVWKTMFSLEMSILASTLLLMTTTKKKPLLYLLNQLCEPISSCCERTPESKHLREVKESVNQLDDYLFGLMKTYHALLTRHDQWVQRQNTSCAKNRFTLIDSSRVIDDVNEEMQVVIDECETKPTLDLRLKLFDVLERRCESLEQGVNSMSNNHV
jgi:hypothetical protein